MFNPRVQKTLGIKIEKTSKDFDCQPSKAFIIFCLQNLYGLDDFEAEEAVTDAGNDRGIDAIFSQKDENGNSILYIVQSKFFQNPEKFLDEAAKSLMIETITNYVLGDVPTDILNQKLRPKIEEARELRQSGEIDKVMLLFFTNGQRPQTILYEDLDRFCGSLQQVDYRIYTEQEISELILPASSKPTGRISLKVSKDPGSGDKTFLNLPDIDQSHGKVIRTDIFEIAKLVENNKGIFNANVRGFLGKNKVNKQILDTLSDEKKVSTFVYLNNGITILCDNYQIKPGNEVIDLVNPSIINGCQTASTIFEAYKLERLKQNTGLVLVRIIESTDPSLKEAIIKASNTQSVVKNRDLISEDYLQKQLESQFDSMGFLYQRKRGSYLEINDERKEKIIDLEKAAQAYMSLFLELPAEAKNKKAEIYDDYYPQIFHSQISAESLLVGFQLLEWFKEKIKSLKKTSKYSNSQLGILGNALLHLLPLFKNWALIPNNIIVEDIILEKNFIEELRRYFDKYSSQVISRLLGAMPKIEKQGDFKNYQYFFKSSGSLVKILSLSNGEADYEIELSGSNYKRRDLRYTKPQEYSLDGQNFKNKGVSSWQDLFILLMDLYTAKFVVEEGDLDFIESGNRKLLITTPNDEDKKIRKKINNGLWLLTNFDSKRLADFCFSITEQLHLSLVIKLRSTKYRENIK